MSGRKLRAPLTSELLAAVLTVQIIFALTAGMALIVDPAGLLDRPLLQLIAGSLVIAPIVVALFSARRFVQSHLLAKMQAQGAADLMDTVLRTSREWVWAVDDQGNFTFSNRTCATLLGYEPLELIGKPFSMVIEPDDLARARQSVRSSQGADSRFWNGVIVRCRHRDGNPVWVEVSGSSRPPRNGQSGGFDGTSRPVPPQTAAEAAAAHSKARIRAMIDDKTLLAAFQPIHDLSDGSLIGVEALLRFVSDDGAGADFWFKEAAAVGLAADLEFAALETTLAAVQDLPPHIYVALNISPATCLDPRLPGFLQASSVPLDRLVLELTERLEIEEYDPLISALAPLRRHGLRIAVDDAGSGFASMRHVLHIRPDIIKLDRSLIAGIDDDQGQRALGAAMVEFSKQISATLVAEGIETSAELAAVTGLGMTAGQGYHLGRPTVHPGEWAAWSQTSSVRDEN